MGCPYQQPWVRVLKVGNAIGSVLKYIGVCASPFKLQFGFGSPVDKQPVWLNMAFMFVGVVT